MKKTLSALLLLSALAVPALQANEVPSFQTARTSLTAPQSEPLLTGNIQAGWASKYVTEGINCLQDGGIYVVNPTVTCKDFSLTAWYASGDTQNYDELDLVLSYTWNVGKWTITPWYEHQFYFTSDDNVANPALTIGYAVTDWFSVGGDIQEKVEDGTMNGYFDLWISGTWEVNDHLALGSKILVGYNEGYNHDTGLGMNTIDYSATATWKLCENLALIGSVNYSEALSVLRRVNLGDDFWVGVQISYSF